MLRRIIKIDQGLCNGCGACASACHEGAIQMVSGKARLVREDYCDGLGDCLPACPVNAISFEEREAPAYDEAAVLAAKAQVAGIDIGGPAGASAHGGCPGARAATIARSAASSGESAAPAVPSMLANWPVQIKLAPLSSPYFSGAELLVAADCCAFAYGNFHAEFMRGKTTLIGCPKLDGVDYTEKLAAIIAGNAVSGVTIARMEVPCCGGLEHAVRRALQLSGKQLPLHVVTISTDGRLLA
ncbi:MAG: ATP-binding protein [Coriobacteriales bacterium]